MTPTHVCFHQQLGTFWWNHGSSVWYEAMFQIPSGHVGVVFEAERGYEAPSDHAIDDIVVYPGLCVELG